MSFEHEQGNLVADRSASSDRWQGGPVGGAARADWPTLCAQLDSVLAAPDADAEALGFAARMLACWADAQLPLAPEPETTPNPPGDPDASPQLLSSAGGSTHLADVSMLSQWPSLDTTRAEPNRADRIPAFWSEMDDEGRVVAKASTDPVSSADKAHHDPAADGQQHLVQGSLAEAHPEAEPQKPELEELSIKEKNMFRKPKHKVQWGRSSTAETRQENKEAKAKVTELKKIVEKKSESVRQAQDAAKVGLDKKSADTKGGSGKSRRTPEQKLRSATNDLSRSQKKLSKAEQERDRIRKKNRDPIGDSEREEEKQRETKRADDKKRWQALKKQIKKIDEKIDRQQKKIDAGSPTSKDRQTKIKGLQKQKWEVRKEQVKQVAKTIRAHSTVKAEGTIYKKEWGKFDHKAAVYDKKFEDEPSLLNSKMSGVTQLLVAKQEGGAEFKVGTNGINGKAEYKGTAALLDYQRKISWDFPHHLFGEDMNAKLFLEVRGLIGAEAAAQVEANISIARPKGPQIDSNAVMAGVDAFAGAKLQLGAGAAYEWKKKSMKDYEPKLQNSARALHTVVGAAGGLGYLLQQLTPTSAVAKILGWLLEHGSEGTVPLLGLTAKGEASVGAGATAKAAIGLRKGKLVAQVKASATLGVGLGGEIELMVDIIEGPLFLLLTLGQPELRQMICDYVAAKIRSIASFGIELGQALYDWFTSDDKARELVAHNSHQILALPDRIILIQKLTSGYCGDDDERAILSVLRDAKSRGDLNALVSGVGRSKLTWNIDGANNDELRKILGE